MCILLHMYPVDEWVCTHMPTEAETHTLRRQRQRGRETHRQREKDTEKGREKKTHTHRDLNFLLFLLALDCLITEHSLPPTVFGGHPVPGRAQLWPDFRAQLSFSLRWPLPVRGLFVQTRIPPLPPIERGEFLFELASSLPSFLGTGSWALLLPLNPQGLWRVFFVKQGPSGLWNQ